MLNRQENTLRPDIVEALSNDFERVSQLPKIRWAILSLATGDADLPPKDKQLAVKHSDIKRLGECE